MSGLPEKIMFYKIPNCVLWLALTHDLLEYNCIDDVMSGMIIIILSQILNFILTLDSIPWLTLFGFVRSIKISCQTG